MTTIAVGSRAAGTATNHGAPSPKTSAPVQIVQTTAATRRMSRFSRPAFASSPSNAPAACRGAAPRSRESHPKNNRMKRRPGERRVPLAAGWSSLVVGCSVAGGVSSSFVGRAADRGSVARPEVRRQRASSVPTSGRRCRPSAPDRAARVSAGRSPLRHRLGNWEIRGRLRRGTQAVVLKISRSVSGLLLVKSRYSPPGRGAAGGAYPGRRPPPVPGRGLFCVRFLQGEPWPSSPVCSQPPIPISAPSPPPPATCGPPECRRWRVEGPRRCARSWRATLAGGAHRPRRHRHRPGGRGSRRGRGRPARPRRRRRAAQLGDPAARAALAAPGHRRAPPGDLPRARRPGHRPAAGRGRRAQPDPADRARPGPAGPGDAAGRRRARLRRPAGPARRAGLHPRRDGHRPRRVRRPRRHRRRLPARPPSTRSASSSGATRSASCAASPSRTSARSPPSTSCTPPAAASCCSPPRSATGPLCSPARTRTTRPLRELLERLAEGIPAEGMESLIPALVGGAELELLTDLLPAGAPVLLADPERIRTRAADLVRTGQEFLEASWFAAGVGGDAPIDVGASRLPRPRRGARARRGDRPPGRHAQPADLRAGTTSWRRPCTRSSPTAATPTAR